MLKDGKENEMQKEAEEQKKPRTRGKDKKPRKRDGYKTGCAANLEKARANSPIMQDCKKEMPPGYNSKRITFMRMIISEEPLDPHDVEEMERRFSRYLDLCTEYDMKVGNLAAYAAIGISKKQALDWERKVNVNPERSRFIQKVRQICGMYREGLMEDGKVNPVTGIFWQKNYDGLRDQQEMLVTTSNPLGDQKDTEAIKQKYLDNTIGVVDIPENDVEDVTDKVKNNF